MRGQHVWGRLHDAPNGRVTAGWHVYKVRLYQLPVVRNAVTAVTTVERYHVGCGRRLVQQRRTTGEVIAPIRTITALVTDADATVASSTTVAATATAAIAAAVIIVHSGGSTASVTVVAIHRLFVTPFGKTIFVNKYLLKSKYLHKINYLYENKCLKKLRLFDIISYSFFFFLFTIGINL